MAVHGYDYDTAKLLKLKGLSYKQISDQIGIPYEALKRYGIRHGWDNARDKIDKIVSQTVTEQLITQSGAHLLKMSSVAGQALDQVAQEVAALPSLDALEKLARVADVFDRIARRTYGLDAQQQHMRTNVQVNIGTSRHAGIADRSAFDDVIEVHSEPVNIDRDEDARDSKQAKQLE